MNNQEIKARIKKIRMEKKQNVIQKEVLHLPENPTEPTPVESIPPTAEVVGDFTNTGCWSNGDYSY